MKTIDDVLRHSIIQEGLEAGDSSQLKDYVEFACKMYEKVHKAPPTIMWRASIGHVLENWRTMGQVQVKEASTSQSDLATLRDYGFELLVALLPNLIGSEIVVTQPAKYKNYSIFYQDFKYGTTKLNSVTAEDYAIRSRIADNIPNEYYTADTQYQKTIATGNGVVTHTTYGAGNLFLPIIAGTVTVSTTNVAAAAMTVVDDSAGGWTGSTGVGVNTINYVTGAIEIEWNAAIGNGALVLITYDYSGEGSTTNAMEYKMQISELQNSTKERRLRYNFSIESQFSYKQQWGRSMDTDLLAAATAQIRREIDQGLIAYCWTIANTTAGANASAGTVTWDRTSDTGVQYFYWREQFVDTLVEAGNLIVSATHTGDGNIACGGVNLKQVVQTLGPRFKGSGVKKVKGPRLVGTIDGDYKIYYDPSLSANNFFVTYNSGDPLDPNVVFSPWMPLFVSEPHMIDNGKLHRYLITSNGQIVVNRKYFVKGTLTKS